MKALWRLLAAVLTGVLALTGVSVAAPAAAAAPLKPQGWYFKYGTVPEPYGLGCEYAYTLSTNTFMVTMDVSLHGCTDPGWVNLGGSPSNGGGWARAHIPHMSWSLFDMWTGRTTYDSVWPSAGLTGIMRTTRRACFQGHPMVFDLYIMPGLLGPGWTVAHTLVHRQQWFICGEGAGYNPGN